MAASGVGLSASLPRCCPVILRPKMTVILHALVRCAQIAAAGTFSTGEIYPHVVVALSGTAKWYSLAFP